MEGTKGKLILNRRFADARIADWQHHGMDPAISVRAETAHKV
jgi:hypothetical protein